MAKLRIGTLERLRQVEGSVESRLNRVRKRSFTIIQVAVAAGLAYWVAQELFNHHAPFFAPITAIIILGLTGGDRIRRALELSMGVTVGVGLGDLLVHYLPGGIWQIPLIVAISLTVASFLSKSPLVSNQVAIGSILIATILPPGTEGGGPDRMIDAFIGSVIGLATIALLPSSPLHSGRQEVSKILGIASSVLDDVAGTLDHPDVQALDEALEAIHNTQPDIDRMISAAKVGREVSNLSPLRWGARRRVRSLERILPAVENCMNNTRVMARRALVLSQDGDSVSTRLVNIVDELADITASLSDVFDTRTEANEATDIPELVRRLQVIGARAGMEVISKGGVLSEYVILAQTRSITADLLEVCGWSRESSLAALAPTSQTPAYPPEVWPGILEED
ncbi:FUSC family protein [Corynebacterium sp. YIM 101645]|uniref:FUSC family protein n=1 Tax=Corynebacterium lemuris TaxID=1859292 RepID=A0ABT2FXI9_9CORY|nr:FUSC family protein [Corynebacterium lemuris]MCS5479724.1 FUSC family protein [Corynebacterium lemuris]